MPRPYPTELLTPAEMARADAAALAAGMPTETLMEAAGRAVARAIRARFRPCRTIVLAGPGNNGGDGYVAARYLEQAGWPVAVAALAPPSPGTAAAAAAARWHGPMAAFNEAEVARAGLVVDALFGAGLTRPLAPEVSQMLRAVRAPLVAVDVPSGLDGATGQVLGFAPQAALTISFFRLKPGHVLLPGRALCGETVLANIGLPDGVLQGIAPRCWRNHPSLWALPSLGVSAHKYTRGHLTILAGATMPGAARLAAAAARRLGAGLVTLHAENLDLAAMLRADAPGQLVSDATLEALLADARRKVWLAGPGLLPHEATGAAIRSLIEAGKILVADAGALMAAAEAPDLLRGAAVITPHAGEFDRLFGTPGADRLSATRIAAARLGAVVVLKGPDSIIAAPDGRVIINDNAPPCLATAGTGDILAGAIAALLAQGMAPFEAAAAGVWLHGAAAASGPPGLIAEDLPALIAKARHDLSS
ncbi:MAG: NAD(P)H-hydrate dehydratase [Roseomonas sp.]|nr:NAD(P)H-hydrate dehydratase [Roseomonas sp.]MCA3281981.1 NAD(P)H-hydrate dehydratase [Roseomonas sp.]MCA3299896.1 NAD(P)H-hydrate dehydratase [Roseomonas sp.]